MCVSAAQAEFKGTKILVHAMELDGVGDVRVMIYQNQAQNLSTMPNAMLLHIPSDTLMGPENFIDMTHATDVLDDMVKTLTPRPRGLGSQMYASDSMVAKSVQVFESGQYTVVLANDARDIHAALSEVPVEKRPYIEPELLEFYQQHYGKGDGQNAGNGYQFVLACFNNRNIMEPAPIGIWYVPSEATKDYLVFPALDSHTGFAPDVYSNVEVDHWLFASDSKAPGGVNVRYSKPVPEAVAKFLPKTIVGKHFTGSLQNGDFICLRSDVSKYLDLPKMLRFFPGVVSMN